MTTLYLSPYRRMTSLRDAMDRLFDESFVRPALADTSLGMPVDVEANSDRYILRANVPGLAADDLNVEVLENTVTIHGELHSNGADEDHEMLLRERRGGKFSRTLTLPTELDAANALAELTNGVLTLEIPKAEVARPRQISVKVK